MITVVPLHDGIVLRKLCMQRPHQSEHHAQSPFLPFWNTRNPIFGLTHSRNLNIMPNDMKTWKVDLRREWEGLLELVQQIESAICSSRGSKPTRLSSAKLRHFVHQAAAACYFVCFVHFVQQDATWYLFCFVCRPNAQKHSWMPLWCVSILTRGGKI